MKQKLAVLVVGTYREIEFLLKLFPLMAGKVDYDLYLVLRHVNVDESSRLGGKESDFSVSQLQKYLNNRVFICDLPAIDRTNAAETYLVPVGPTSYERECGMLSMFQGIFAGVAMIKAAMRTYTHVMKTRSDYLPWEAPWIDGMIDLYERSGKRIIVDGLVTQPQRYPDKLEIPWQGSLSDIYSFSSYEQFLTLWDFESILQKTWTGVGETTFFRAAMWKFLADDHQSVRRNKALLEKYFTWQPNATKLPLNLLRAGVLSDNLKEKILKYLKNKEINAVAGNKIIRMTYDFIIQAVDKAVLNQVLAEYLPGKDQKDYMKLCVEASVKARPI